MKMSSQKFPDRLRAMRELRQLSQTQLATRSGLQPSVISHFETGRRVPSFDNLRRLAEALEVTADYLLGRTGEPKASGITIDRLFRSAEKLSQSDLEALASFSEVLAGRAQKDFH